METSLNSTHCQITTWIILLAVSTPAKGYHLRPV